MPLEFIKVETEHVVVATFHAHDFPLNTVPISLYALSVDTNYRVIKLYGVIDSLVLCHRGRCWTPWYAAHVSLHTIVPGKTCCWIMGRRVAASCWASSSITPSAGVTLTSTIPNTHFSQCGGRLQWFYSKVLLTTYIWLLRSHFIVVPLNTFEPLC